MGRVNMLLMPALLVHSVTCNYLGLLVITLALHFNYNIFQKIILIDTSINQQETYVYDINHICLLSIRLLCGLGCSGGNLMAICKQAALAIAKLNKSTDISLQ